MSIAQEAYLTLGLIFSLWSMVCAARDDGRGVTNMNTLQMTVLWLYLLVRG